MKRRKTWAVLSWPDRPDRTTEYELGCPKCGAEAYLPTGLFESPVIATFGLAFVFDRPGYIPAPNAMPDVIRCRQCRTVFEPIGEKPLVR